MAEVRIRERLWQDFIALAHREHHQPTALAKRLLREYIQRAKDEELDARIRRTARRAKFRIENTEEIIRQYRRRKASKAGNGRSQASNARRS